MYKIVYCILPNFKCKNYLIFILYTFVVICELYTCTFREKFVGNSVAIENLFQALDSYVILANESLL